VLRKTRYRRRIPEPRLPLERVGGSLVRCDFDWENVPIVQLQTKTGWWGNLVDNSSVGSKYADNTDDPIQADGNFLARRGSEATVALNILKAEGIASSIDVEVLNPYDDRTEAEIKIVSTGEDDKEVVLTVGDYRKTDPSVGRVLVVHNDPNGFGLVVHNTPGSTDPVVINTPE
jgi:phage gp46-like protein